MAIFHGIVNLPPTTALPTTTSPVVAVSHDVHCTLRSSRKRSPRNTALALYDGQNLKISNHCRQALTLEAFRLKSIVLAFFFSCQCTEVRVLLCLGPGQRVLQGVPCMGDRRGSFQGEARSRKVARLAPVFFCFCPGGRGKNYGQPSSLLGVACRLALEAPTTRHLLSMKIKSNLVQKKKKKKKKMIR